MLSRGSSSQELGDSLRERHEVDDDVVPLVAAVEEELLVGSQWLVLAHSWKTVHALILVMKKLERLNL